MKSASFFAPSLVLSLRGLPDPPLLRRVGEEDLEWLGVELIDDGAGEASGVSTGIKSDGSNERLDSVKE